ncbi:MAG: polysaccharide deacetylase family protein [Planctomycetia bacterium]|nr:polysaccharide deacetylase family protein [Planctomycetia bacterium]
MQTQYIAAYDLESIDVGLAAAEKLVKLHRKHDIPATFFVVGKLLESDPSGFRSLLGDPLFDIQSHSYSHKLLRDSGMHGPGCSLEEVKEEVERGKQLVEDIFGRPCPGMRSACGFTDGMKGQPEQLKIFCDAGLKFISTDLRGPADSIPSLLQQAYWYEEDGFADLLELPGHGWHDCVLKPYAIANVPIIPWPLPEPWIIPDKVPETPEEEFSVHRRWIDKAIERDLPFVSLILHPWSLVKFHPEAKTVDLLLSYVRQRGLGATTYGRFAEQLRSDRSGEE